MTHILHIIGLQGSGKSTLARAIWEAYQVRGVSCENLTDAGVHEPGMHINVRDIRMNGYQKPYAINRSHPDVVIIEHLDDPHPDQVESGDLLIRLERAA